MKKSKYQKKLDKIREEVLAEIWKIFEEHQEDGELSLIYDDEDDEGEGISLDYITNRENKWEQFDDGLNYMDKNGELYTDWDMVLNIKEFTTCELVRFWEQLTEIYE